MLFLGMAVLTRIGPVGYGQTVPEPFDDLERELPQWFLARMVLFHTEPPPGRITRLPPRTEMSWAVAEANMNQVLRESLPYLAVLREVQAMYADDPAPAKTRRPPVKLVVLVLIWLILVVGPLADGKLPAEVQTMLSTEVGTVALGLAITQMINQKK